MVCVAHKAKRRSSTLLLKQIWPNPQLCQAKMGRRPAVPIWPRNGEREGGMGEGGMGEGVVWPQPPPHPLITQTDYFIKMLKYANADLVLGD